MAVQFENIKREYIDNDLKTHWIKALAILIKTSILNIQSKQRIN